MLYLSFLLDVQQHLEEAAFAQVHPIPFTIMACALAPAGVQHPKLPAITRDSRLTPAEVAAHRTLSLIGGIHQRPHSKQTHHSRELGLLALAVPNQHVQCIAGLKEAAFAETHQRRGAYPITHIEAPFTVIQNAMRI